MDIEINNLIHQLVPPHKRQPLRMRWLTALLSPFATIWDGFTVFRNEARMLVNVNSQTAVLEGYLRAAYEASELIAIESYDDGLIWIPLSTDSEKQQVEFFREKKDGATEPPDGYTQNPPHPEIPRLNEIRKRFGDVDFIVYIPAHLDRTRIEADIDRYKQALTTYRIVQAGHTI